MHLPMSTSSSLTSALRSTVTPAEQFRTQIIFYNTKGLFQRQKYPQAWAPGAQTSRPTQLDE